MPAPSGATAYRAIYDSSGTVYYKMPPGAEALWRVHTSDGMRYEFGEPSQHRYFRAPLIRQVNAFGFGLEYSYQTVQHQDAVDYVLSEIRYVSPKKATTYAKVTLAWDPVKTCPAEAAKVPVGAKLTYRYGEGHLMGSRRLASITTWALRRPGREKNAPRTMQKVRRYALSYANYTESCTRVGAPKRQLTSVQETGYSPAFPSGSVTETTMPATRFDYGSFSPIIADWQYVETPFNGLALPSGVQRNSPKVVDLEQLNGVDLQQMLLDFDGDGRVDLLKMSGSSCSVHGYRNVGTHFEPAFTENLAIGIPSYEWCTLSRIRTHAYFDQETADQTEQTCSVDEQGNPTGPPRQIGDIVQIAFRDVTHDGIPDLVRQLHYDAFYSRPDSGAALVGGNALSAVPSDTSCSPIRIAESRWTVYPGTGDGFANTPEHRQVFRTLDANSVDTSIGETGRDYVTRWNNSTFVDLNGDGREDFAGRAMLGMPEAPPDHWYLRLGDEAGQFHGPAGSNVFLMPGTDSAPTSQNYTAQLQNTPTVQWTQSEYALRDINGDGLADRVARATLDDDFDSLVVWYNRGWGFADQQDTLLTVANDATAAIDTLTRARFDRKVTQGFSTDGVRHQLIRPTDLDYDGYADFVVSSETGGQRKFFASNCARVSPHTGTPGTLVARAAHEVGRMLGQVDAPVPANTQDEFYGFRYDSQLLDLTGDGLLDLVVRDEQTGKLRLYQAALTKFENFTPGQPPYRLHTIHNGRGATTSVTYASTGDAEVVTQGMKDGVARTIRSPKWVVSELTVDPGSDPPPGSGIADMSSRTRYRYEYPVFNADQFGRWGFRGFETVERTNTDGAVTRTSTSYDEFWRGLPEETATYPAEAPDEPATIVRYAHKAYPALHTEPADAVLSSDPWLPWTETSYTCALGQSRAACLSDAARATKETTWTLEYAGATAAAYIEKKTYLYDQGGKSALGARTTEYEYESLLDNGAFRLRKTLTRTSTWTASGATPTAESRTRWESKLRYATESIQVLEPGLEAITQHVHDPTYGLQVKTRKPKQYAENASAFAEVAYDEWGVHAIRETNELGHRLDHYVDFGTGQALRIEFQSCAMIGGER